ncbi:MAG: hypothetical protein ACFFD1_08395, partial [Candidatus Thorarchaeota archaeon]
IDELIIVIGSYQDNFVPNDSDIPFPNYNVGEGAIFLVDVNSKSIVFSKFFDSAITLLDYQKVFEIESYIVSTKNLGTFSVTFSEKSTFWVASIENPIFVSSKVDSLKKTFIATTDKNGVILISELEQLIPGRYEIPQLLRYSVKNVTNILIQHKDKDPQFFNPIIIDYDRNGLSELLLALSNGTIILRSLNNAEIWRINVGLISQFDASSIKTSKETNSIIIVNNTALSMITKNGEEISFTRPLPGTGIVQGKILTVKLGSSYNYEHLILHIDNKITIFDPVVNRFIWNFSLPGNEKIVDYKLAILNKDLLGISTHLVILGVNGYLGAIALPILENTIGTRNLGVPTIGTWQHISIILDNNKLNRIFAISDQGEMIEYYYDSLTSNFKKNTVIFSLLSNTFIFQVVNQGILGINLFIVFPGVGITILQADGTVLYSNNHMGIIGINNSKVVNNQGVGFNLALTLGNQIVILSPTGKLLEVHSYSSEIISVTPWRVDFSQAESLVLLLKDGSIAFTDSKGRKLASNSLKMQPMNDGSQDELYIDLETDIFENIDSVNNTVEVRLIPLLLLIVFTPILLIFGKRSKKRKL